MAYGKNRRSTRSRRNRNSVLSTRKIYSKRSSKAQANQIYALRRKVNYIARRNKPETKVLLGGIVSKTFDSQTLFNTYWSVQGPLPGKGPGDDSRIGDFIRVKSCQISLTLEYYNSSETGYHTSESAGTTMRVIVVQSKSTYELSSVPEITEILSSASNTGITYTHQAVTPLKTGLTEKYRVLKDFNFTLTTSRNQRLIRFSVKPYNYRWNENGYVNNIFLLVISAGLHSDTNFSEFVEMTGQMKLVYTDS